MMGKDDPKLEKLNAALTAMKKDGALAGIHKKWFGADPAAGSATVTELPIPKG
jgi:polar amino acid transport system substrate-binding protein